MKTNEPAPIVKPALKTLMFVIGTKGGIGKTGRIIDVADYFAAKGRLFDAVDCDQANKGKPTSFGHVITEDMLTRFDLRDQQECENLLSFAIESETGLVIADLPGSCGPDFLGWWKRTCSPEILSELNLRVIVVGVVTALDGTFASVVEWAEVMQGSVSYVIALNRFNDTRVPRPIDKLMPEYFTSETGKRFREMFKPVELVIPALEENAMTMMRRSGLMPSVAAESPSIFALKRRLIKTWITEVHEQWAKVDQAFNLS